MAYDNEFALTGENAPLGGSPANNIDGYILDNTKKALDERYSVEHRSLNGGIEDETDPNAEGRHIPGVVGCLYVGTSAEREALSNMGVGAICRTTDDGNFWYYSTTGWQILAINSDTIFADEESLTYDANTLRMKRDNQQWTQTATLVDAATVVVDLSSSNSHKLTLGGNRTMQNPTNEREGSTYVFIITQDGTGGRTLSWGTNYKFPAGLAPVLSTSIGAVDIVTGICQGADILCSVMYDVR